VSVRRVKKFLNDLEPILFRLALIILFIITVIKIIRSELR
jgi:hypothetical protein